ncbi:MAG TPA: polyprenyl synthetase family protein [Bacteroides sp.]|nr:polyprenyl synthetase family protein [Bacteroides sp.]
MLDFEKAQQIVNSELESYSFPGFPAELYDPVRYILSLEGKRVRSALALMACSIFSDAVHQAVKPALAFEVFHNFTLLHDDIMDNSPIRRGEQTVHEKWNPNTAILSGDVMSILSYRILSESEDEHIRDLIEVFTTTALQVCEGQQLDINFESRTNVSVDEYLKMVELKTAVLVAASLKAGAITGGAGPLESDLLYEFGRNLGIAFQIRDDYLDVFGDSKAFGKKIGNDILANKKTFLLIGALEQTEGKVHDELEGWLIKQDFDPDEKIKRVTEIFKNIGFDRISSDLASSYYEKALQYLERINVPSERKLPLAGFAKNLMERDQ